MQLHVEQFEHKNQFLISTESTVCLQSYQSLVAVWDYTTHRLTLGSDWDYSNTTMKHVYDFISRYTDIEIPYDCKNKRAYVQRLINTGEIDYDYNM